MKIFRGIHYTIHNVLPFDSFDNEAFFCHFKSEEMIFNTFLTYRRRITTAVKQKIQSFFHINLQSFFMVVHKQGLSAGTKSLF